MNKTNKMKKISRRQVVLGLGAASAGALLPAVSKKKDVAAISPSPYPSCAFTPEQTEGPFYFETGFIRQDITEGRPGKALHLKLKVVGAESCEPIQDAVVDIWHCDAAGEYSGFETANSGSPRRGRGGGRRQQTRNEKTFLRGAQVTNSEGEVEFKTIYPGWYQGRATHIHIKVYLDNDDVLTSQMYFPEELNDHIYQEGVYAEHEGNRVTNDRDGIFRRAGSGTVLELTEVSEGYVGTLTLGVNQ